MALREEELTQGQQHRQQHRDADKQVCSACSQNGKEFDGTGQVWWEEKDLGKEWWGGAGLWALRALEGRLL